jgi:transketolase
MTPSPYIHYGVREHGMGAIMNGLALHGGIVPYGGTFFVLCGLHAPSHTIGGVDALARGVRDDPRFNWPGRRWPNAPPIEHLASLRAIPNMRVFRPGDAVETAACWHMALSSTDGPSVLALSRQAVSPLPTETPPPSRGRVQSVHSSPLHPIYRGAYIVRDVVAPRVVIYATGSEVELALSVADALSDIPCASYPSPVLKCFAHKICNTAKRFLEPQAPRHHGGADVVKRPSSSASKPGFVKDGMKLLGLTACSLVYPHSAHQARTRTYTPIST